MSELLNTKLSIDKSTWIKVKLGDVVTEPRDTVKDFTKERIDHVVGLEHIDAESIHLRRSANMDNSTTFTKKFKVGDVLFGRRRAYLKKAVQAKFSGICSGDITVMRVKKDLLPELLPFVINNEKFFDYAVKHSAGGLSPRVKFKDLANYEFLLPPKDQQTKLVELLWAIDEVVEKEVLVLNELDGLLKSTAVKSFDYGYGSYKRQLPSGWAIMKIKDFSIIQAGATPLRSNNVYFDGGTIPWLKTLDLNNDNIYETEECITEIAIQKTSCKVRPKNTVLVAMYGGFNQIGRTGLLKIEAATNQAVSSIIVDNSVIKPEYLLYVLNMKVDYWKKVAISSRKDPNITKNDIENFPVPIPSLEIQDKLISKIKSLISSNNIIKSKIDSSKALQKSLINQIF